jgi:hypothetical protein
MMKCPQCEFTTDSDKGFKSHMSKSHGGYYQKDLTEAGITANRSDIARSLDSGRKSIGDTLADAPEGETENDKGKGARAPRQSKANRAEAEQQAEFERLRPLLLRKWERRLRIPYGMWARLSGDPNVALSSEELKEGAEMHVDFVQAMGWLRAGKVEAVVDLAMWHGATILSRSKLGQQLIASFDAPIQPKEDKLN